MFPPRALLIVLIAVLATATAPGQAASHASSGAAIAAQIAPLASDDARARGQDLGKRGVAAFAAQRFDEAEQHWMAALAAFELAGDAIERANTLRNLTFLPRLGIDERVALLDEALALVRDAGNPRVKGMVLAQIADFDFIRGDYASAAANLDAAVPLLDGRPDSRVHLARALTSRGRLHRALNRNDAALDDHRHAARLLEELGDLVGASQARHGMGFTALWLGRVDLAIQAFSQAVTLARRSGDDRRLAGALAQSAVALQRRGRADEALARLAEVDSLGIPESDRAQMDGNWALVLLALDRPGEALARVERALRFRASASVDGVVFWLSLQAEALERLGRRAEALESSSSAVAMVEGMRARLVPEDDAKRGFGETRRKLMSDHVARLAAAARPDDALEAAERARARAFLDLLATTDLRPALAAGPPSAGASLVHEPRENDGPAADAARAPNALDQLVAARRGASRRPPALPEPDIASVTMAEPPTLATVKAQAARLGSHIVSYWVTRERTFVWVVSPVGHVSSAVTDVAEARLTTLVERTVAEAGGPTRGVQAAATGESSAVPLGRLAFDGTAAHAYRELYRLLVAPVRGQLPPGAVLTVVPHGPLFRLSFAALMAPSGRYLVEDFALHYAPSANALDFTGRRPATGPGPVLVIADPAVDPGSGDADPLPRLPGAAREGRRIAQVVGVDGTRLLQGAAATEQTVRQAISGARVLHFATHGIVRDDRPFDSFLALAGPAGPGSDNDGRLTAGELYGLRLNADLVVLGACRTAAGPVTGDGIVGMTRGIFAAGAPSVIASLWDLPDTVTASVFPAFYTERHGGRSKAEALRRAQLSMIRDLRAGRVWVDTPAGRFALPEHPSVWGALILVGEP